MTMYEIIATAPIDDLKRAAQEKVERYPTCQFDVELAYEIRRWAKNNLTPEQLSELEL